MNRASDNLPALEKSYQLSDLKRRFDSSTSALQVLQGRDLSGKVALITGCNTGIGFETARSLALHECEVIFACRNEKATREAIERITEENKSAGLKCCFVKLDLASLKSTRECAKEVKSRWKHLDMLILNAGVSGLSYSLTEDGFETIFQVLHLSHFHLTTLLSDLLNHTSRVVVVSSELHRSSKLTELSERDLSPPPDKYCASVAYNNAKLCNVLFTAELARRWKARGISVFSLHPGTMVSSQIARNWWVYRLLFTLVRPFTKSLQQAASTTIYCATAEELNGLTGLYFNNCYVCNPSESSKDVSLQQNLWELSEEMIKRGTK